MKLFKKIKREINIKLVDKLQPKELIKVERRFKQIYDLDVNVIYIDAIHRDSIRPGVNGFRDSASNYIVVFITNNLKANCETLLHELTHEYQARYMSNKLRASKELMNNKKVSYKNSWHERHAKECASMFMNGYSFDLDIRKVVA